MRARIRPALTLIILVGLVAACGTGGEGDGPNPTAGTDSATTAAQLPVEVPDPCALATTQEASAALGKPTAACELLGREQSHAAARFLSADGNPGSINITVNTQGRTWYDSAKAAAEGEKEFAELTGIGDAAFFQRPFTDARVIALKGPFIVEIEVGFVDGPPAREKAVTLAGQVVGRVE